MEKTFLTDPGYFIHLLEVRICFCTFVLVVFGTPCSLPFPIYKLLTSTLYFSSLWRSPLSNTRHVYFKHLPPPTPSNVFEINKTIGGGGSIEDLRYFSAWKWFIRGYIVVNR